jgi:hypothetical protein
VRDRLASSLSVMIATDSFGVMMAIPSSLFEGAES